MKIGADTCSVPYTKHTGTKMKTREKKDSTIHGIMELELEEVQLEEDYDVVRTLGEGYFAKVVLANHRRTATTVVLKQVHKELTCSRDFFREYHYNYHLSPHPNILSSYPVAFVADNCYTYALEYAPYGDLTGTVKAGGLPEDHCKKIAKQLTSAVEFLHSKQLVHRDIKLENVLVFDPNMDKVKLCDFGSTRRDGALVSKVKCTWSSFQPPEVCDVVNNEKYHCAMASDTWQVGVVIFVCLTGCPPWQKADEMTDPQYKAFSRWRQRRVIKMPTNFRKFSVRLLRLFRRLFENKPEKRPAVTETLKYLKDTWMPTKLQTSTSSPVIPTTGEVDTPTSAEGKPRSKKLQSSCRLEAAVDQNVITKRIWEWISSCESYHESNFEGI